MVNVAPDYVVGDLIRCHPSWARVFEQYGIDYDDSGNRPLSEVCEDRGIDLVMLAQELEHAEHMPVHQDGVDWRTQSLRALVQHILQTHHAYLRCELPRLGQLLVTVVERHGSGNAALRELASVYSALASELTTHMRKEEVVLFPWVCEMEATRVVDHSPCVTVRKPIRVMEHEHRFANDAIARIRWLAEDFRPPGNACPAMRVLYAGLKELEIDLLRHIEEENEILFPLAIDLEAQLSQ